MAVLNDVLPVLYCHVCSSCAKFPCISCSLHTTVWRANQKVTVPTLAKCQVTTLICQWVSGFCLCTRFRTIWNNERLIKYVQHAKRPLFPYSPYKPFTRFPDNSCIVEYRVQEVFSWHNFPNNSLAPPFSFEDLHIHIYHSISHHCGFSSLIHFFLFLINTLSRSQVNSSNSILLILFSVLMLKNKPFSKMEMHFLSIYKSVLQIKKENCVYKKF